MGNDRRFEAEGALWMKRIWRLHHADLAGESGEQLQLSPEEAHHARHVLRLKDGDQLRLFDGKGTEWSAVVTAMLKNAVEVRLLEGCTACVEAPLVVEIFQGLCRQDRMELVIQKGTELGVAAIHPLYCERGDGRSLKPKRLERWKRIAVEAAKQCGRSVVPEINASDRLPRPEEDGPLPLLLTAGEQATPLGEILAGSTPRPVWLAVGPEPGFSDSEASSWAAAGWRRTSLGPRILRTETAGLAAAAIILHLWGDLGASSG
jgi:16S rRNA (uracil1498-N3)-methyltransferase